MPIFINNIDRYLSPCLRRDQSLLKQVQVETTTSVKASVQSMQHSLVVRERKKMPIPKILVHVAESGNVQGELTSFETIKR